MEERVAEKLQVQWGRDPGGNRGPVVLDTSGMGTVFPLWWGMGRGVSRTLPGVVQTVVLPG